MLKMTPWFPPEIKPVHVGEYNASYVKNPCIRRYWNGVFWSMGYREYDPDSIKKYYIEMPAGDYIKINWRGLAEKPEDKNE